MSWHFSQAMEEGFLDQGFYAGVPSAPWKTIPLAADDSCSDKMKGTWHRSPYGMMFAPSKDFRGGDALIWFLEVSLALIYPQPDSERVSKARKAGSGWKWPGSWAKYNPSTSSWKTRQCSLLEEWDEFSETWPRWGIMRDGELLEQTPVDFRTIEPACGWLPTPSGVNGGSNHTMGRVDEWGGSSNPLRGKPIGKALSPNFEEIVMGWPIDWTAQTPLGTAKFQQWLDSHGRP